MCKVATNGMLKILHNEDFPWSTCYLATASRIHCTRMLAGLNTFSLRCSCLICVFPVRGRVSIRLLCLSFEQLERNLYSVQRRFYFSRAEALFRCSSVTSSLSAVPLGRNISPVCPALHCFLTLGINGVGLLPGCSSICTLSEILLGVHKPRESAQRGQTLLSFV